MKRFNVIMAVFVICFVIANAVLADDKADVKAAVEAHWAAINGNDASAVADHHTPDFTGFLMDGSLRWGYSNREQQKVEFQAMFDAGTQSNWQIRHFDVQVYGSTAIASFYLAGSAIYPGGLVINGPLRVTEVWIKQGGKWKEAHHHDSPVVGAMAR